jgi:hypothetical protein
MQDDRFSVKVEWFDRPENVFIHSAGISKNMAQQPPTIVSVSRLNGNSI